VLNWIICDGDVDPEWIEALNSVLDDNHLLTLPTGERISFGSNVNFIFETDNLQFASPATVSRMGMIYMNDEDININSIILKWTKKLKPEHFVSQQVAYIEETVNKIWKLSEKQLVATTKVGLVRNALSLIEDSTTEQEFRLNLVKGLASNFDPESRAVIFEAVFGKGVPGNRDPLSLRIANGKIG
jgi:dynein heavy chain 2